MSFIALKTKDIKYLLLNIFHTFTSEMTSSETKSIVYVIVT
jgi:hypothetical protein